MVSQAKNILILVPSLQHGGGAERVAAMVGSGLNQKHNTHFLTFYDKSPKYDFSGSYTSFCEDEKNRLIVKVYNQAKRAYKINRYCRHNDIDVVISFMEEANFSICLSRIWLQNKSKIICSVRSNPLINSRLYKTLMKQLYPYADKNITISYGVEKRLKSNFGLRNTSTIHNPINMQRAKKLAREPLPENYKSIFSNGFTFINIGRLSPEKGHSHLIRSFSYVVQNHPNAKLVILGEGELRTEIENLVIECGLQKDVFLPGIQNNVFTFLDAADHFVFSSLSEGLGNVLLESLAVGTPVISTDCETGPRESLAPDVSVERTISYPLETDSGVLTQPFSKANLYQSTDELSLTNPERQLAETMIEKVEKQENTVDNKSNLMKFRSENILDEWSELI